MAISKWDLFKQIEEMPNEKYPKIKAFLDDLNEQKNKEVILGKQTKNKLEKSFEEYSKGEYLTFDQVYEKGEDNF